MAEKTRRVFVDTDEEIVKLTGKAAEQLFLTEGEDSFRRWESQVIRRTSLLHSTVIATGGGAVLNRENTDALRQNGRILFLDRPLEQLVPTADRPLAKTPEAIRKLYQERYDL
ncbi:MAG: hypothetical protein MJ078_02080 [Clostridia bacterium]|nr:hypothetical protein [Clostridia bacterium]